MPASLRITRVFYFDYNFFIQFVNRDVNNPNYFSVQFKKVMIFIHLFYPLKKIPNYNVK
jgi:hypothetical protein